MTKPKAKLTRESLHKALEPPNNCRVKAFLETIPDEDREIVEEALKYDKQDFPASAVRDWLVKAGFPEEQVPGADPINDHRAGRRPCRCKG